MYFKTLENQQIKCTYPSTDAETFKLYFKNVNYDKTYKHDKV